MQSAIRYVIAILMLAASAFAGVTISSPAPGSTSASPVHFAASASSSAPITAIRIYVDSTSVFLTFSNNLDTLVPMSVGVHSVVVQAWDSTGAVFKAPETITVIPASGQVTVSSPANNATVGSPFPVVASASGTNPITAMQIYLDGQLQFTANAASVNTQVAANVGTHSLVVQAWDTTGAVYKQPVTVNVSASSGFVNVTSPANNATIASPFQVIASASASNPITAMQIYLDGQLVFANNAASLNTNVSASTGSHSLVVQAWDSSGAFYKQPLAITVSSSVPPNAIVQSEIQNMGGWENCTTCAGAGGNGPPAGFSMLQFQASPSLSGSSAQFNIWGSTPYSDVLWWKQLGGNNGIANFQYDLDFYITAPQFAQALEFDVNQSTGNTKFIFGTQCNIRDGGVWDIWDTAGGAWRHTNIACPPPAAFVWHHVTWEFTRNDNQTIFVALTFDGVKHYLNWAYWAKPWSGSEINVAFQMDGDYAQHPYSVWLDNVTLAYW